MAWYKQPLSPLDPVIKEADQGNGQTIRYLRDNFEGGGQDSNTLPPAQDPSMWEVLSNIQPITQGCLSRRWGYQLLTQFTRLIGGSFFPLVFGGFTSSTGGSGVPITSTVTRMYSYQNNITLARQLVYCSVQEIFAGPESGGASPLFNTISTIAPRMVDSRNYAYFYDGTQGDLIKWDGASTFSKWGISSPAAVNNPLSVGPNNGSTATQVGTKISWANVNNVLVNDGSFAIANSPAAPGATYTNNIQVTGFGFAIPLSAVVTGIRVEILGAPNNAAANSSTAQLLKASIPYGDTRTISLNSSSGFQSFNSNTQDLWGPSSTWTPADVNNTNFGIQFNCKNFSPFPTNFKIDNIRFTVYYNTVRGAISVSSGPVGTVNLTVGRTYYCVFQNSSTGHLTDLNPASGSTGPVTNGSTLLSTIPVSLDPQVDSKVLLATADGGDPSILYFLAGIPNSQTTYTDTTLETTLNLAQQYLFTDSFGNEFGLTGNDPPPNGTICIKHKGRLWMAQLQNLFFSKSVTELTLPNGFIAGKYEESWPPQDYFDISGGAETISGLFSDGNVIYVGTQNHIRRIFGDAPSNFQQPEICHQNVGVLNQEVWQAVFLEGTPTGFMWLSPDFKVMGSDGNTYLDVGHSIQDVLSSINPAAAQNAHAMFVQQGPYDLYILAIPTGTNTACDTHCVFDMRSQKWLVWQPTDQSTAMLFNVSASGVPMWLFATEDTNNVNVYQYMASATQDRVNNNPVDFVASAETSFLHLGSPTTRKILDELEVAGDPSMVVSIVGASSQADFSSPVVIASNLSPTLSPFATLKVYLSGKPSKYHYYQLEFQSLTNSDPVLLNSFALRAVPWNTL